MRPILRYSVLILASTALLTSCARNPVTGKSELQWVSTAQEVSTGEQAYMPTRQSQGGDYIVDPTLTEYVQTVGRKLAQVSDRPDLPYEFTVLNNSVPNAWALPGGKIAVNRGLLAELKDEAELAAVLGHEIVHAAARHGAKSMERGLMLSLGVATLGVALGDREGGSLLVGLGAASAQLVDIKYGRDAELEADRYGMSYMSRAGYDVTAAVELQETFVRLSNNTRSNWIQGLFASHPPSEQRVAANRRTAAQLGTKGSRNPEIYANRIERLKRTLPAYTKLDEGYEALRNRNPAQALTLADEAIRIEPDEALFYELRGEALVALGRSDEAKSSFDSAIQRNKNQFRSYLQRGLLEQKQNAPEARADLERSISLLPNAPAYYALGEDALARGERAEAKQHFSQAAQSDSNVGRRATNQLVRLDIVDNPGKYISVKIGRNAENQLVVALKNDVPVALQNITVAVAVFDSTGNIRRQDSIKLATLAAQAETTQTAAVGPINSDQELRLVRVRVFSAELAQ